ncbi:hypothetical protein EDD66_103367 [Mobilisporobacter senegalensis]|uniref:Lipoprotein n=1 Tax=Mobilisporobacter senegalensis TaxID=1329262 RepID=A0A3N1XRZ7_9FIRM|nr:hypothetical protein [Mobilisporobacter senegalensis]ROR29429.1 hypothetical protein EDD66_103367 [Mobilisporobacter senegalensis]
MKRIILYLTILLTMTVVCGCSKSEINLDEVDMDTKCEVMIRKNSNENYMIIEDEVIHNNLLHLLRETISKEKIIISKNGRIPFCDDWQIKISGMESEDFIISFSTYYKDEYSDGGKSVMIIEKNKKIEYYYIVNNLYNFMPLARTNNRIFVAKVTQRKPLQVVSDYFETLELQYDSLDDNIMEGSLVEVTLGKITETSTGLNAESVVKK